MQIVYAIGQHETGWRHDAHGKSGEVGALQFLPTTWARWSNEVLGYKAPMTLSNSKYVAGRMVDRFLKQGLKEKDIALMWNSGQTKKCSAGINKYGVEYDSCAYVRSVLALLQ